MTLLEISLYFIAAAMAGAVNSVAGGGTFLTFPALIFGGLSPLAANVTSTVALWPGSIGSAFAYRGELKEHKGRLTPLLWVSLIGGGIGAVVLLETPERTFAALVPWLLLTATLIFTFGRQGVALLRKWRKQEYVEPNLASGLVLQFIISIYGGYFGAGIGILMLAMLQLAGFSNIHQMNGLKTWLAIPINGVSVLLFALSGKVVWPVALVMLVGALTGGYWGAKIALKLPPHYVRWFVTTVGIAMTLYFFLHGH